VQSSNYNSRNRVPEIIVSGDSLHLVRRRETINDQLSLESLFPEPLSPEPLSLEKDKCV